MSGEKRGKAELVEREAYNEIFDAEGRYIGYPIYQLTVNWMDFGGPPAWCEVTATYVQAKSLCQPCSQYDFKKLLKQSGDGIDDSDSSAYTMPLGTIGEIATKTDCSFCHFLITIATHSYGETGVPTDAVCTLGRGDDSFSKYTFLYIDCTAVNVPGGSSFTSKRKELALWRDDPFPNGAVRPYLLPGGAPAKPFFPLSAMAWLVDFCVESHPKCSQQERLGIKMTTQMFAINVNELLIVPAPDNCKYVALSYVWGEKTASKYRINPVEASTDTNVEFPAEIPSTIIHAMNVAKQLGFTYLWVDQLCIPRDCREKQISEMDKIYRNATLTIIAAVQDAESGLPGVGAMNRKRDAPHILRVNEINIGPRMPMNLGESLQDTPWVNRGWTYQENVLSSRKLIFTEHDVYYRCLEGEKGELECHQSNEINFTRDTFVELGGVLATAHGRVPFQIYGDCVDTYSVRNLTYPADILNGFAGLVRFFSDRFDWKFCWGLPDDNFGLSLLWTSSSTTRRDARDSRGRLFPSWSWAGWMGAVSYYGFRPKGLQQATGLFKDFVAATWDPAMLENALESGVLVLDGECVDITEANSGSFQNPYDWGNLKPFEGNEVQLGSVFFAIVLLADKEPHVRGLMIRWEGGVAHRIGSAGINPEKWLSMPRMSRRVQLA
jgi:hypothetical protein